MGRRAVSPNAPLTPPTMLGAFALTGTPTCAACHGARFVVGADGHWWPCACAAGPIRRHVLVRDSLGALVGTADTRGWLTPRVEAARALLSNAAQQRAYLICADVARAATGSVALLGDHGTGKSSLLRALALALCDHPDTRVQPRYVTASGLVRYLRDGIDAHASTARLREFVDVPVLLVDDLGAQGDTDWSSGQLLDILDARYERGAATVLATNATLDGLGARLGDRLLDRRVYRLHVLRGESLRERGVTGRIRAWSAPLPPAGDTGATATTLHRFRGRDVICPRCDTRPHLACTAVSHAD